MTLKAAGDLRRLLQYFGATAAYLPPALIVGALLGQHIARRDPWKPQPRVIAGMLGESILVIVPLIALGFLTDKLLAHQATGGVGRQEWIEQIAVAAGAGVYEEFLFRLLPVSLSLLLFVDVMDVRKDIVTVGAVLISACAFSLYHIPTEQLFGSEPFPWGDFLYRTCAGGYLGGLFVFRGFGIAVAAHAFYNFYVVISRMNGA